MQPLSFDGLPGTTITVPVAAGTTVGIMGYLMSVSPGLDTDNLRGAVLTLESGALKIAMAGVDPLAVGAGHTLRVDTPVRVTGFLALNVTWLQNEGGSPASVSLTPLFNG